MMKITTTIFILFFGLYLFQSCDSQKNVINDVSAEKPEKIFKVNLNDTLKIELKSNPTTGFVWKIDNKIKPKVIKKISKEFVKNDKTMDMVGAGGFDVWKFETIKTGEVYLHYIYAREDGKIDKEKYYKVVVK